MKKIILLLILFVSIPAFSQSVNDYQYVIVPIKFDFLKENDKFRLNTLTKLLLQKYTFKSYLSTDEIPAEIENKRCSILYATVIENNGFLVTKVKVVLKDCKDKVVYETEFGSSREKEFPTAYNQALRAAFKSFDQLHYKYNGKTDMAAEELVETKAPIIPVTNHNSEIFFFAQPIANGYQVVDSEPKVIMKLFNTSQKNVFIAVKGNVNGIVISKNDKWFFEYYQEGKLVSELLDLKF